MLFKIFLLGVILLASAAMGSVLAGRMGERGKLLCEITYCVKTMKNAMIYQGMTLSDALLRADRVGGEGFFAECAQIAQKHPEIGGRQICRQALSQQEESFDRLQETEKEALFSLFDELARAETPEEITAATGAFSREIGEITKEISEKQAKKAKLVRSLCFLGGLTVAIILV